MINTSIVYDHRGRTGKDKEGPLEVRVTVNRKPYYINTGVRVRAFEWKHGVVVDRVDCVELNERLAIIMRKVEQEINACIIEDKEINVAEIRQKVLRVREDQTEAPVLDWIEEQVRMLPVDDGTRKHYDTLLKRLLEFGKIKRWTDVSVENIYGWNAWLHSLKTTNGEKLLSDGGVYNYHKNLKHLLYIAEKIGRVERNPYAKLKGEFKKGEKENVEYLTADEIDRLRELDLEDDSFLDKIRDLFVFQIFTGMAYADAMKFDINDYREVDGKWLHNAERVKTGVAFVGQLLPPVVEILKKYDWKLPTICNQDYNRGLKVIAKYAKIKTRMHTHLARHTFGTFMLSEGVKIQNLQRMMGHKDIHQTLRYAKTLAKDVHDDFDMIGEKMKKGVK